MNKKTLAKKSHARNLKIVLDKMEVQQKHVTPDEARQAFNILARFLNERPEMDFDISAYRKRRAGEDFFEEDQYRYTLSVLAGEEIFIADTIHDSKSIGYVD